ncbi:hypothetical protein [Mucilaginibacter antarcticus]|uniref:hypothetical protein n=1 Tax=Mucilaginibacter antarcticus TaxID=1855725 RepID=UPI00362541A1
MQERKYKNITSTEEAKIPSFYKLSRNSGLEKLGINNTFDKSSDFANHLTLIKSKTLWDFNAIFAAINESKAISKIFINPEVKHTRKTVELKNIILKNLRSSLRNENGNPVLFAEDADINPNTFFYREQMNQLFEKNKFLIQGFKGTGKTYLYKALRDPKLVSVKNELLRLAHRNDQQDFEFIDIISLKGKGEPKSFDFDQIQLSKIQDKSYYFKNFWLVYTWNSIFLDADKRLGYSKKSTLHSYIKPYETAIETKQRFEELIFDQDKLALIEKDLVSLDLFLTEKKKSRLCFMTN